MARTVTSADGRGFRVTSTPGVVIAEGARGHYYLQGLSSDGRTFDLPGVPRSTGDNHFTRVRDAEAVAAQLAGLCDWPTYLDQRWANHGPGLDDWTGDDGSPMPRAFVPEWYELGHAVKQAYVPQGPDGRHRPAALQRAAAEAQDRHRRIWNATATKRSEWARDDMDPCPEHGLAHVDKGGRCLPSCGHGWGDPDDEIAAAYVALGEPVPPRVLARLTSRNTDQRGTDMTTGATPSTSAAPRAAAAREQDLAEKGAAREAELDTKAREVEDQRVRNHMAEWGGTEEDARAAVRRGRADAEQRAARNRAAKRSSMAGTPTPGPVNGGAGGSDIRNAPTAIRRVRELIARWEQVDTEVQAATRRASAVLDGLGQFRVGGESDVLAGYAVARARAQATLEQLRVHLARMNAEFARSIEAAQGKVAAAHAPMKES